MVPSLTNDNRPTTAVFREHKRTDQIYLDIKRNSIFIENSFFNSDPNMEQPTEKFENRTTFISNNKSENEKVISGKIQKRTKPSRI